MSNKYYVIRAITGKETKEYYFEANNMDFEIMSGQIRNDYRDLLNKGNIITLDLQGTTADLYNHHRRKTLESATKNYGVSPLTSHMWFDRNSKPTGPVRSTAEISQS